MTKFVRFVGIAAITLCQLTVITLVEGGGTPHAKNPSVGDEMEPMEARLIDGSVLKLTLVDSHLPIPVRSRTTKGRLAKCFTFK